MSLTCTVHSFVTGICGNPGKWKLEGPESCYDIVCEEHKEFTDIKYLKPGWRWVEIVKQNE
jgi:hypothetical protein